MHVLPFAFSLFTDGAAFYKKRRFNDLDMHACLVDEYRAGPSSANAVASIAMAKVINLAPNDILAKKRFVTPLKVYASNNIFLEVKEFRKAMHIGLFKEEDGVVRNNFNFGMNQPDKMEEAFSVLKDYVRSSGQ